MLKAPTSENRPRNARSDSEQQRELQPQSAETRTPARPAATEQHSSVRTQQTYGNQAVLRTLGHSRPTLQANLVVNQPGDVFEQEADSVADLVMRMQAPARVQRRCAECEQAAKPQRKCAHCEDEEKKIQRQEAGSGPEAALSIVHQVLNSPGQPLDAGTRAFMEPRFGYDLGQVRVHADARAAESADALNALAYTVGNHVAFAARNYAPDTESGRHLLAHELAHVVQQDAVTLRRQQTTGLMTRGQFEQVLRDRYAVVDIHTGTQEEQAQLVNVAPADLPDWQSWDPGTESADYSQILRAFEDFANVFGGTPNVRTVVFFRRDYNISEITHAAEVDTETGASFSFGTLTIYELFSRYSGLPMARSNASGTYPGAPVLGLSDEGSSPGAPIPVPTREQSIERNIMHELGHGLAEAVLGSRPDRGLDPAMIREYAWAVGWATESLIGFTGRGLYDIGVPAVQDAFNNVLMPPAQYHITTSNWNDPRWVEQPISNYMVKVDEGEDFAEAVRTFIEAPDLLRARSPHRFNFLQQHEAAWRSRLLRPHTRQPGGGIGTGIYIVLVDDANNDPLMFHRLTPTEPWEGGPIVEVSHDGDGYYYMWKGRRIQLPGPP